MQPGEAAPVWLHEEPDLLALLHAAVDRFDRLPAQARQRDVSLPVEQYLPVLTRADAAADQTWRLVCELQKHAVLTIRRARRGPFDPDWKGARLAFSVTGEAQLRSWLQREALPPELQRWRTAVSQYSQSFPGGIEPLLARRIAMEGRSNEELAAAFAAIAKAPGSMTLRQLSALAFWGDSKFLDDRGELIAALFPHLDIRTRTIVVAVHLPAGCEGVLFIENQDTYTKACSGSPAHLERYALVFASGFRSSAERVRMHDGALLHYAGNAESRVRRHFESWWFGNAAAPGDCWFWGDLDFAGMHILKALRSRFGNVTAWQPGYAPMLAILRAAGGYSPDSPRTRGQSDPGSTGCSYADEILLPAIRQLGQLDQEFPSSPGHG